MKHLLTTFLICIGTLVGYAQKKDALEGIAKELTAVMEATHAPGFGVAVVKGKEIIYAKGFGYQDYENKIPVDTETLFAIGSSTKAFTSGILGQLRHEDKLSFDDSPIKYIPELRFYNDELNNHVIIKDLMSHRTGIPRHDYSWYLFPTFDKDSLLARIPYLEPFTGVRRTWYYNNFMFLVQGIIAERITGKSWEDNIRERFFEPLGMSRSNVSIDELEESTNAALGYETDGEGEVSKMDYYRIAGMRPAGSINSSVSEMSNWLITWINNGTFEGKEIFPAAYVQEAISSHMVVGAATPDEELPGLHLANYGYGWFISSYKGHYRVEHGGNIDGFSANVAFYPSDSIGIVVLANQNGSAAPALVRNTLADRLLGVEETDWAKRHTDQQKKAKEQQEEAEDNKASSNKVANTRPSHILQDYTGTYENPGYGAFTIAVENDSLFAHFKLRSYYLRHEHYDVFEPFEVEDEGIDTTDTGPLRFNFVGNNAGDISHVKVKIEPALDHPIEFKREPSTIEVDEALLEKYVGTYELSDMKIKVYTKQSNILYLFVQGQPEYELLATDTHKFSFKTLEGFKVEFVESAGGAIDEMTLFQPNGTFTTKRVKEGG